MDKAICDVWSNLNTESEITGWAEQQTADNLQVFLLVQHFWTIRPAVHDCRKHKGAKRQERESEREMRARDHVFLSPLVTPYACSWKQPWSPIKTLTASGVCCVCVSMHALRMCVCFSFLSLPWTPVRHAMFTNLRTAPLYAYIFLIQITKCG